MRISDWSSDVCSSDLPLATATSLKSPVVALKTPLIVDAGPDTYDFFYCLVLSVGAGAGRGRVSRHYRHQSRHRSEEHTSELQSLMRHSYAVFCLKKKNTNTKQTTRTPLCV